MGWGLRLLLAIGTLWGAAFLAAPFAVRGWARKDLTPAERKRLEEHLTRRVRVPEEWKAAPPAPPRLVAAADALTSASTKDEITSALLALAWMEEFDADQLTRPIAVDRKEFHKRLFRSGVGLTTTAEELAAAGDWDGATSMAVAMIRLARRHPASDFLVQARAVALLKAGTGTLSRIAVQCPDPAVLEPALNELRRLRGAVVQSFGPETPYFFPVGELRAFRREGYPVSLEGEGTESDFLVRYYDAAIDFPRWKLRRTPPDSPDRARLESGAREFEEPNSLSGLQRKGIWQYFFTRSVRDVLFGLMMPSDEKLQQLAVTAGTEYDELLGKLADRVEEEER